MVTREQAGDACLRKRQQETGLGNKKGLGMFGEL